jgi:hypothetical protein
MIRLLRILAPIALLIDVVIIIVAKTFLNRFAPPANTSTTHLALGAWPFLVVTAFLLNPTVVVLGLVAARSRGQRGWFIGLLTLLLLGVYAVPLLNAIAPDLQHAMLLHDLNWVLLIANLLCAMPAVLAVLLFTWSAPGGQNQ